MFERFVVVVVVVENGFGNVDGVGAGVEVGQAGAGAEVEVRQAGAEVDV